MTRPVFIAPASSGAPWCFAGRKKRLRNHPERAWGQGVDRAVALGCLGAALPMSALWNRESGARPESFDPRAWVGEQPAMGPGQSRWCAGGRRGGSAPVPMPAVLGRDSSGSPRSGRTPPLRGCGDHHGAVPMAPGRPPPDRRSPAHQPVVPSVEGCRCRAKVAFVGPMVVEDRFRPAPVRGVGAPLECGGRRDGDDPSPRRERPRARARRPARRARVRRRRAPARRVIDDVSGRSFGPPTRVL